MIKYFKFYLILFIILSTLLSCGSKDLELHGKMNHTARLGYNCWYIETDQHIYYEVITEDKALLRDGLRVYLYAIPVQKKTICDLPLVIEVKSYVLDPDQKVEPSFQPTPGNY